MANMPETALTASETRHTGFTATMEVLTSEGPQQLSAPAILGRRIQVWNGAQWVEGMPRTVAASDFGTAAVEIVTSEGRLVRCSAQQHFLLANNTTKAAGELRVGDTLARSVMPAYPGSAAHTVSDAFKRGAIYGTAMANFSASMLPEFPLRVGIPHPQEYIMVDQQVRGAKAEFVRNPHLVTLGYSEMINDKEVDVMRDKAVSYARARELDIDHSEKALVLLDPAMQTPQTCLGAPVDDRMRWCAGAALVTRAYNTVTGVRAHVAAFAAMVNSCGPKYEINVRCTDSTKNMWEARPFACAPDARAPPTVFAVTHVANTPALYNIDGVDTLMIGGQLVCNV